MTQKHTSSTNPTLPRKIFREKHAPKRSFAERTLDFIKSLGEWRDRALVITGLFYAAGYLIWSWNALQNNLGLLPAFQFQYIVAGIGPVVIGAISIGGGLWFWRFLNNVWLKKVETGSTRIWQLARLIFQMIVFISLGSMIFFSNPTLALILLTVLIVFALPFFPGYERRFLAKILSRSSRITPYVELSRRGQWGRLLFLLAFLAGMYWIWTQHELINQIILKMVQRIVTEEVIFFLTGIMLPIAILFGPPTMGWLTRIYRVLYFLIFVVGLAVFSLFLYQDRIYAQLPQEFGGVKPRCAYLDIKTENLSDEMRTTILRQASSNDPVARSNKLDVLFASGSSLMVRMKQFSSESENTVYEIPRNNIQSITWCR